MSDYDSLYKANGLLHAKIKSIFETETERLGSTIHTYSFLYYPYKSFIQEFAVYLTKSQLKTLEEIHRLRGDFLLEELDIATLLNGDSLAIPLSILHEFGYDGRKYKDYLHQDIAITNSYFNSGPLGSSTKGLSTRPFHSEMRDPNIFEDFEENLNSFLDFLKKHVNQKRGYANEEDIFNSLGYKAETKITFSNYTLSTVGILSYQLNTLSLADYKTVVPIWELHKQFIGDFSLALNFVKRYYLWVELGRPAVDYFCRTEGEEKSLLAEVQETLEKFI